MHHIKIKSYLYKKLKSHKKQSSAPKVNMGGKKLTVGQDELTKYFRDFCIHNLQGRRKKIFFRQSISLFLTKSLIGDI